MSNPSLGMRPVLLRAALQTSICSVPVKGRGGWQPPVPEGNERLCQFE
jgi:hypothetical protein